MMVTHLQLHECLVVKRMTVYSPETRPHCVGPSPLGTPTTTGPIVPAPDDRRAISVLWNENWPGRADVLGENLV
jgi:hypothetical protein